jgi:octaprenyl-diphosphate synthase
MKHSAAEDAAVIRKAILEGDASHFQRILGIVQDTGALEHAHRQAGAEAELARQSIQSLPDSQYKTALLELSTFAVARDF